MVRECFEKYNMLHTHKLYISLYCGGREEVIIIGTTKLDSQDFVHIKEVNFQVEISDEDLENAKQIGLQRLVQSFGEKSKQRICNFRTVPVEKL